MVVETLKWVGQSDGYLELIDQRLLPERFERIQCRNTAQLFDAIKTLAVRGAPAIGVAAAYGVCLAMQKDAANVPQALSHLAESIDYLASARPTAVNLFWALDRMKTCAQEFIVKNPKADLNKLRTGLLNEANTICQEDKKMCEQIGINGEKFIRSAADSPNYQVPIESLCFCFENVCLNFFRSFHGLSNLY